ncbi:hypothetical protein HDE_03512 [Halotydeus destructor]|nr:hypothetical protein HDE_03512 [Halotydeus destructor]
MVQTVSGMRFLNWILLVCGMFIGKPSKIISGLNALFCVLRVTCLFIVIYLTSSSALKQGDNWFLIVMMSARCLGAAALILVVIVNRPIIGHILDDLTSAPVSNVLRRYDEILALALIFFTVMMDLAPYSALHMDISGRIDVGNVSSKKESPTPLPPLFAICVTMITAAASSIYIYVQLGVAAYVSCCQEKIRSGESSIKQLREMYHKIQYFRIQLNRLGLIPFILCSQLFTVIALSVANYILYYHKERRNGTSFAEIDNLTLLLLFLAINLTAEYGTKKACEIRQQMFFRLANIKCNSLSESVAIQKVLAELGHFPVIPALAWDVLVLEKAFILQFFGALVPFTAMVATTSWQVLLESQKSAETQ